MRFHLPYSCRRAWRGAGTEKAAACWRGRGRRGGGGGDSPGGRGVLLPIRGGASMNAVGSTDVFEVFAGSHAIIGSPLAVTR